VTNIKRDHIRYEENSHNAQFRVRVHPTSQQQNNQHRERDRTAESYRLDGRDAETSELPHSLHRWSRLIVVSLRSGSSRLR